MATFLGRRDFRSRIEVAVVTACFLCGLIEPLLLGSDDAQSVNAPREWRNVAYGRVPEFQTLDLFLPQSQSQSVPLVIWIHGGAWKAGR